MTSPKRERPTEAIDKLAELMGQWGETWPSLWCAELMAYATSLERENALQLERVEEMRGDLAMWQREAGIHSARADNAEQRVAKLEREEQSE
jgi:hypothetical protein